MNTNNTIQKSEAMAPRHIRGKTGNAPESTDGEVLGKIASLKSQHCSFHGRICEILGMPPESTDDEVLAKLTAGGLSAALKDLLDRGMSYSEAWCRLKQEPRFANYFKKA